MEGKSGREEDKREGCPCEAKGVSRREMNIWAVDEQIRGQLSTGLNNTEVIW